MNEPTTNPTDGQTIQDADVSTEAGTEVVEELLVEEISIDGMCGVY